MKISLKLAKTFEKAFCLQGPARLLSSSNVFDNYKGVFFLNLQSLTNILSSSEALAEAGQLHDHHIVVT